jgi:hypothetical protein
MARLKLAVAVIGVVLVVALYLLVCYASMWFQFK